MSVTIVWNDIKNAFLIIITFEGKLYYYNDEFKGTMKQVYGIIDEYLPMNEIFE